MSVLGEPSYAAWASQAGVMSGRQGGNLSVGDMALPDMVHMIDPHWYQYPPLNPLWHSMLGFAIVVLGCTSVTGNGMVIYIFSTTKSLRTPSNLLVVNLAFSDFLMMATMAPPMVINCYNETWVFGPLFCEIYGMLGSLFGCTSIWTMTMIAFDRYNVIVKGLSAKPLTSKGALVQIFLVWAFSLGWTVAPLFGWNRYVPEGNMAVCGTDNLTKGWHSRSYILLYSWFVYFLPLFVIIYSYTFIIQAVAAHEAAMREQAKKMNVASLRSSEAAQTSAECKLAKVALMTISLWFMAWTPYLVINYAGIFDTKISPIGTIWSSIFAKANAVYNPIVYGISHPKYRQALQKKFPSLVCTAEPDDTVSQTTAATAASEEKPAA
uniref:LW-sensitive opsin n=2 Tax=Photinus marginellus TaxID=95011 RepID=A0A0N9R1N6_9COLE|nr:LW-sensitive opsin [Photinus marginellus]APY20647.1 long wavelength sensitive opsin [Photinus marginellus]